MSSRIRWGSLSSCVDECRRRSHHCRGKTGTELASIHKSGGTGAQLSHAIDTGMEVSAYLE